MVRFYDVMGGGVSAATTPEFTVDSLLRNFMVSQDVYLFTTP